MEFDLRNLEGSIVEGGATRSPRGDKVDYTLFPVQALHRVCKVLTRAAYGDNGAVGRGAFNWRKGEKYSRLIERAMRHLVMYMMGKRDEDHLSQAICNIAFLIAFEELGRTDLDDSHVFIKD